MDFVKVTPNISSQIDDDQPQQTVVKSQINWITANIQTITIIVCIVLLIVLIVYYFFTRKEEVKEPKKQESKAVEKPKEEKSKIDTAKILSDIEKAKQRNKQPEAKEQNSPANTQLDDEKQDIAANNATDKKVDKNMLPEDNLDDDLFDE